MSIGDEDDRHELSALIRSAGSFNASIRKVNLQQVAFGAP
jgi:hypothetical protein